MALYDTIGHGYASRRRPDPRLAAAIRAALGDATSVVNIGAGTGSYEPTDLEVLAVEPSEVMVRQRPPGAARCILAKAEALPLESGSFDAAMAILTIHHWTDLERGLSEMARVARRRVVVLTWLPDQAPFWLTDEYFPQIAAHDRDVFPSAGTLVEKFERAFGMTRLIPMPIPHDCVDGLLGACWRRPERYLDPLVRSGMSSFARIDAEPGLARLRHDLATGQWTARHGGLLAMDALDLGYRIVVAERRGSSARA